MTKVELTLNKIWEVIKLFVRIFIKFKYIVQSRWHGKCFSGKKVLIIANGPSLKNININQVIDKDTEVICVNYFPCKDNRFFELKPRYLCLLDSIILSKNENEDKRVSMNNAELENTLCRVDWKLSIIKLWNMNIEVENNMINYINLSDITYHGKFLRHFFYSHNIATAGIQNVVIGALFFSVISGADIVYLAGVDNSEFKGYEINENNEVYLNVEHHYGNEKIRMHNIPQGEFTNYLKLYCKMFEQYQYLADYVKSSTKAKIINLNPYSYVDVFDKSSEYWLGDNNTSDCKIF